MFDYILNINNPLGSNVTNLSNLINVVTTWIFNIAVPIAVVMIIYSGIIFLISRGQPAKISQAKGILTYAVIGLAIVLIGRGFVDLIMSIINVTP